MGSKTSRLKVRAGPAQPKSTSDEIPSCADALAKTTESLEEARLSNVPDKFERLATFGHLQVDWELVRGSSLRHSLRWGGQMWLRSPMELDANARMAMWNRSRPVKKFDMFLSHTWRTSGIRKVLSLLLQSGYKVLLAIWFCGVAVAVQLSAAGWLPLPWRFEVQLLGTQVTCLAGPWILLASALCSVLGLFVSPYLGWPVAQHQDDCFIDVASIHQTDAQLMERGIYGIGGFLSISRELRVLWSPAYLSRLWCVFELAAYRTANPGGKLTLAPLFVEVIVYVGMAMNVAVTTVWWLAHVAFGDLASETAALLTALLPCFAAMHTLRNMYLTKHQLISDLEHFDLKKVQCSNDFDKKFIYAAIEQWYGSKEAFTSFVRGPLRAELLSSSTAGPSLVYLLIILTPVLACGLTFVAALCAGGAPMACIVSYVCGSFLAFNVCWLFFLNALLQYLCDRYAEPRWPGLRDWGQTLLLFVPLITCLYGAGVASRCARARSVCVSLAWLLVTFIFALGSWKYLKPLPSEGRAHR